MENVSFVRNVSSEISIGSVANLIYHVGKLIHYARSESSQVLTPASLNFLPTRSACFFRMVVLVILIVIYWSNLPVPSLETKLLAFYPFLVFQLVN